MRDNAAPKDAQIRETSMKQISNGAAELSSVRENGAQEREAFAKRRSDSFFKQSSALSNGAQRGESDHSSVLDDSRGAFRCGLRSEKCLHVQCSALKKRGNRLSDISKKRHTCMLCGFDPGTSPFPLPSERGNSMLHNRIPSISTKVSEKRRGLYINSAIYEPNFILLIPVVVFFPANSGRAALRPIHAALGNAGGRSADGLRRTAGAARGLRGHL